MFLWSRRPFVIPQQRLKPGRRLDDQMDAAGAVLHTGGEGAQRPAERPHRTASLRPPEKAAAAQHKHTPDSFFQILTDKNKNDLIILKNIKHKAMFWLPIDFYITRLKRWNSHLEHKNMIK